MPCMKRFRQLAAVKANDNEPVTIKDVIDMVAKAINHVERFFSQDENGTDSVTTKMTM